MRPNFALSLSFDGIGLLNRTGASHWHLVGEVALDSADLSAELAALREKAAALAPAGVTTKLVIPDAQIRYLDLSAADAPGADHEAAAMRALDGATPYALDDLAFDWNVVGDRLYVAAVARETLEEAESFAREHRFNPVSFVARPEACPFGTEPFFGETSQAGARVERDSDPIEIAGAGRGPGPEGSVSVGIEATPTDPASDTTPETPAPEPIRAARDVPDSGAPQLAGAARDVTEGAAGPPDHAKREDGQGAVASPAPAAASLTPRPPDPAVLDAALSRRRRKRSETTGRDKDKTGPVRRRDKAAPARSAPSAEDEADRLTIFGARETQRRQRGKPRFLGLILTSVLLLALAGVAAWATIFPDSGLARLVQWSEPQVAVTPESPDIAGTEPAIPPGPQGAQDAPPETALAPQPERIPAPGVDDAPDAVTDAAPDPPARVEPLTLDEARARYAETGIWPLPPEPPVQPDAGSLDDFYLTSIDEDLPVGDAVALPDPSDARRDVRPETPATPAPPGTTYQFDDRGLVVATPDGALTPDGVEVYSGPPPVQPPNAPARVLPVPGLTLSPEVAAELDRISEIRPRSRPEGLVERHERGALGGRSRSELAGLRPRTRPESVLQAALAAPPDPEAVEAALAEAAESVGPDEAAMSQAVTASLKPQLRPGGLVPSAPRAAPQPQAAAPRIPTSASVARTATTRNAVNMREVNLIGVYGSASNRRALVRLSNGRYRKVEVGDSLDGGRVSAIGDAELRYTRRGRNVVLRMPRS
ncbi:hypothetical protein [Roseovarius sp. D22-M7]|uniref:hypothetical protein n=1 Tax=Roseovarius sp. D22-M7 TaxID=3127116 RepID=UPI00301010F1